MPRWNGWRGVARLSRRCGFPSIALLSRRWRIHLCWRRLHRCLEMRIAARLRCTRLVRGLVWRWGEKLGKWRKVRWLSGSRFWCGILMRLQVLESISWDYLLVFGDGFTFNHRSTLSTCSSNNQDGLDRGWHCREVYQGFIDKNNLKSERPREILCKNSVLKSRSFEFTKQRNQLVMIQYFQFVHRVPRKTAAKTSPDIINRAHVSPITPENSGLRTHRYVRNYSLHSWSLSSEK